MNGVFPTTTTTTTTGSSMKKKSENLKSVLSSLFHKTADCRHSRHHYQHSRGCCEKKKQKSKIVNTPN
ncbi:hypothetical protein DERF_001031 [Dermatophagoides farinae]|uniref:Uncharacterized protein n=1 Tax=Dermatophagoides farinae TaxID=6954 RepID=A0A922IA31_DERFA|nr:hypothetical protein DERF_001031 [Dermatophagoides farinae]